jgi:hypothetical protein
MNLSRVDPERLLVKTKTGESQAVPGPGARLLGIPRSCHVRAALLKTPVAGRAGGR